MDQQRIEDEALHLPKDSRVRLIQRLVLSLEAPTAKELKQDWLLEAKRRASELENGDTVAVPGEQVLDKAKSLLK